MRVYGSMASVLVIAAIVGSGCGDGGSSNVGQRQATPLDAATTGTIRGDVAFDGTPPAMAELPVKSWAGCTPSGGGPVLAGDMLVQDGHVRNAFVWIKAGLGDRVFAIPDTPVEIDQEGCVYVPRVAGVRAGQPILFKNSDPMLHNVRGAPKNAKCFNVSLGNKGQTRTITIEKPEVMVSVRCDVHPWMQLHVGVVDHPYFAVTGPDGRFELPNVPPGDYTVAVWHERFGAREVQITLPPKGSQEVHFALSGGGSN